MSGWDLVWCGAHFVTGRRRQKSTPPGTLVVPAYPLLRAFVYAVAPTRRATRAENLARLLGALTARLTLCVSGPARAPRRAGVGRVRPLAPIPVPARGPGAFCQARTAGHRRASRAGVGGPRPASLFPVASRRVQ